MDEKLSKLKEQISKIDGLKNVAFQTSFSQACFCAISVRKPARR